MVKQFEMELVFNFFLTFIIGDNKDVVSKKSAPIIIGTLLNEFYYVL